MYTDLEFAEELLAEDTLVLTVTVTVSFCYN